MEQRTSDPTVNVVMRSGAVTGGQPTKPSGAWVRKVEDKQPTVDLSKIKETFMHTSKEFCITNPPGRKGKELRYPIEAWNCVVIRRPVPVQQLARKLNLHLV